MSLRNATPLRHSPMGLTDTLDSTNAFAGAMAALINLIPDPTTRNLWQCRPASIEIADFATEGGSFSSDFSDDFDVHFLVDGAGFISALKVVGNYAFGMISTTLNSGKDQPFCYDLVGGNFVLVSNVTDANTPVSPPSTGDWTPPTMDVVGTYLVVTHPGFTGAGGYFFGWFDISDITNPVWDAGNTATTSLAAPPTAVKQFFDRAYFLVNPAGGQPAAQFSDILDPLTITDSTQTLTFGDNVELTALGALPMTNQLGGIIQALIVFKGATNMYQITGDAADTSRPLQVNAMNVATGTLAPNSICSTPKGLAFVAPDGLRVVSFQGIISDPVGDAGQGITVPFIYSVVPSRIAAACNAKVLRITTQNGYATESPTQEFWYDLVRGCWSGPHTFPASLIQPYGTSFIMTPVDVDAKLFRSDSAQNSTSTYVENGEQMSFNWQTSMLPDTQQMSMNAMIETTLNMSLAAGGTYNITAGDQDGALFNSVLVEASAATTIWGGFTWGSALWQGAANALYPRQAEWSQPIVFRRLYIGATGNCAQGVKIGDLFMRYQQLGYLQAPAA